MAHRHMLPEEEAAYDPAAALKDVGAREAIEVRRNEDGSLDEVVAYGVDVHLEQMEDACWQLGVTAHGKMVRVFLSARGRIAATVDDERRKG